MNQFAADLKQYLDLNPKHRQKLFCRGYIMTDAETATVTEYPFYGLWNVYKTRSWSFYSHPETNLFHRNNESSEIVLIGHAYDPFTGLIDENKILDSLLCKSEISMDSMIEGINCLTGVFVIFLISNDKIYAIQDCGGQKMLYFGKVGYNSVFTSSPQLASDIFGLSWDPEIVRLLNTKGYYRGSGFLPGNLSPYKELTRLGANTILEFSNNCFKLKRFFPTSVRNEIQSNTDKEHAIDEMYHILSQNVALTIRKWPRVGLSLTGGTDSKTTFACAKNNYGDFFCYSFESKESEKADADAAARIADAAGVEHHRYIIPSDSSFTEDYDILHQIIEHNTSHICKLHDNEIRKYIWLRENKDFDVEIKSDMSEVGRAYFSRKYSNVRIPRILHPRHLTITQARYFLEPWAMKYADNAYRTFMEETGLTEDINSWSMHDLAYWEVRMSSWAATSLASQEYFHEITIPYNNRRLLELFLRFPESDRLEDIPHKMLMKKGNPTVADSNLSVKDSYLGKRRMLIETVYYYYATYGNILGKK